MNVMHCSSLATHHIVHHSPVSSAPIEHIFREVDWIWRWGHSGRAFL